MKRLVVFVALLEALVAEARHSPDPEDAALLMRVWVAESGWAAERDHAIQGHVLLRSAAAFGGLRAAVEARVDAHSSALRKRPWLLDLAPDCHEPHGYPGAWVRVSCAQLAGRAYALLRNELDDPCPRADGWRKRGSTALGRALRKGYRRLGCGKTVEVYLEEPRRKR